ncbi:MAG TPA: M48 family metallopeptidase [Pseudomonadales bacterium]|nr:M48 family metallopeptidase [Pseudomonadales bacterium]
MTNEEFERLVEKLESKAIENPGFYKFKVFMLAMLGNFYLLAMLFLVIILFIGSVLSIAVLKALALKLMIVVGPFLWLILKSLWVRVPVPQGIELTQKEAPELFEMINSLRKALKSPKFHHVLITNDLNAGVCQIPMLGIFGWTRNYLLLGLPLMKSMTEPQFKAVLAHEFGHLAKGHGRFSNWIYTQRERWWQLKTTLEKNQSGGRFLFVPFLNWFAPYFNAFTFPMARANEFEADATSVRLTSAEHAAEALTAVNVVGSYLDRMYWPNLYEQADTAPHPAFMPYSGMAAKVSAELNDEVAKGWLEAALTRRTSCADTHPALCDRLVAIQQKPRINPPKPGESADRLLGAALEKVTQEFDQNWQANVADAWEKRHREMAEAREALAELNKKFASGEELTPAEAYDRACWTHTVDKNIEAAIAQFRALKERLPDDPYVLMALGSRLLQQHIDEGMAFIQQAMTCNEQFIVRGCEILRDYQWELKREVEAHKWHQKMQERAQEEYLAQQERDRILIADTFIPHELNDSALAELKARLSSLRDVKEVFLVQKQVKHLPHRPLYLLGFTVAGMFKFGIKNKVRSAMTAIQHDIELPSGGLIINLEGDNRRFYRKFKRVPGARLK